MKAKGEIGRGGARIQRILYFISKIKRRKLEQALSLCFPTDEEGGFVCCLSPESMTVRSFFLDPFFSEADCSNSILICTFSLIKLEIIAS